MARVCIVYDGLFPYRIGGADRWYRNLIEGVASAGHQVTFLTMSRWDPSRPPSIPGVRVVSVGTGRDDYVGDRRSIVPPFVFGAGVLRHLLAHRGDYDIVHCASFPFFPLLAIGATRRIGKFRIFVDWHEVWTKTYWHQYLSRPWSWVGWYIQRRCARVPQHAICFSKLHALRLRGEEYQGVLSLLPGQLVEAERRAGERPAENLVVFVGRLIPEKGSSTIPRAIALARSIVPNLHAIVVGDGPDRHRLEREIGEGDLSEIVRLLGFVDNDVVDEVMRQAMCLILPSRREGYGLVVLEAISRGTPVIVASAQDSAATELVVDGINGWISPSSTPHDLAACIIKVFKEGALLRKSTQEWWSQNSSRLSFYESLDRILAMYRG